MNNIQNNSRTNKTQQNVDQDQAQIINRPPQVNNTASKANNNTPSTNKTEKSNDQNIYDFFK